MLSEFVMVQTKGRSAADWEFLAEVTDTTGFLWWRKSRRRLISRKYGSSWFFVDTGKFTPDFQAEELERAWNVRKTFPA